MLLIIFFIDKELLSLAANRIYGNSIILVHIYLYIFINYMSYIIYMYMSQWKLQSSAISNSPIELPLVLLPIGTTTSAVSNPLLINNN